MHGAKLTLTKVTICTLVAAQSTHSYKASHEVLHFGQMIDPGCGLWWSGAPGEIACWSTNCQCRRVAINYIYSIVSKVSTIQLACTVLCFLYPSFCYSLWIVNYFKNLIFSCVKNPPFQIAQTVQKIHAKKDLNDDLMNLFTRMTLA